VCSSSSSTKDRKRRITPDIQPRLWGYIAGIARHHGFEAIKVGGAEDHVHAFLVLPPSMPLAKAMQLLKGSSSKHLNETRAAGDHFAWQEGYGAFSVSASQTQSVIITSKTNLRITRDAALRKNSWSF